jgi:hypothetical protein
LLSGSGRGRREVNHPLGAQLAAHQVREQGVAFLLRERAEIQGAFGPSGKDVGIGSDILVRAALSDEFADASGKYFDNDSGAFAPPHPDALDTAKRGKVVHAIRDLLPA